MKLKKLDKKILLFFFFYLRYFIFLLLFFFSCKINISMLDGHMEDEYKQMENGTVEYLDKKKKK